MNALKDLFLNPVTIIGAILAIMFISMGYLRHLGTKRSRMERERDVLPVKVTDPFVAPAKTPKPVPSSPPPGPAPAEPDSPERTLRQFSGSGPAPSDKSSYLWE